MPDQEQPTGPLDFSASFPSDPRYATTAGDLASKLALTGGCGDAASRDVREAVASAFLRGTGAPGGGRAVELALRLTSASMDTVVSCGGETLLRVTHSRPA